MKAYILDLGAIWNDRNLNVALSTLGTPADKNPPAVWHSVPVQAILIQHPTDGWILFDTGMPSDAATRWPKNIMSMLELKFTPEQNMEHQLSLVGIKPSDIKTVIISHMHMDHIGNISLFKDTANFYVSRAEAKHAFLNVLATPDPAQHGFYSKEEVLSTLKSLTYLDEDTELFDGLELIMLPGHTPGVMGLVMHLENGTVIYTSDACYMQANYEGSPPGILEDSASWHKSLEKIKKLQKKYKASLWFGHDQGQFETLKKAPNFY